VGLEKIVGAGAAIPPEQASGRAGSGDDDGATEVGDGTTGVIAMGPGPPAGVATGTIGLMPAKLRSVAPRGMVAPPRDVMPEAVTAPDPGTDENPTAHGEMLDNGSTFDVGTESGVSAQPAMVGSVGEGLSPPT
jgi:hypothetical protein